MSVPAERAERLERAVAERELDALLVTGLVNVRYLTGFTGSNAAAVVGPGRRLFVTDVRYVTQSEQQVAGEWRRETANELLDGVVRGLDGVARLGFDDAHLTVKQHAKLAASLDGKVELVGAGGLVEDLRAVKDADELRRMRAAAELADEAFRNTLARGLAGRTERAVALDLEIEMRTLGAEALSFPPIVAGGAHGALPHAYPRDVEIERDVLVVIDWGAQLDGYCSDCTRTVATGEHIDDEARAAYEVVERAQRAGVDAVKAGPSGRDVDAVARAVIDEAGLGERFGHGLGHGVGLEVHEGPRLSKTLGDYVLRAGNVVTVEPGVYVPDHFGIRIEDLVAVTDNGADVLTGIERGLTVV